jgi:hypothetical protein
MSRTVVTPPSSVARSFDERLRALRRGQVHVRVDEPGNDVAAGRRQTPRPGRHGTTAGREHVGDAIATHDDRGAGPRRRAGPVDDRDVFEHERRVRLIARVERHDEQADRCHDQRQVPSSHHALPRHAAADRKSLRPV